MKHPRCGFAAPPRGGDAGRPAQPDLRRLLGWVGSSNQGGVFQALSLSALLGASAVAHAAPPHQHGVAQLDAAIEGPALTISLSVPLDSVLGFERAPRTAAEKQAAAQVIERMRRSADIVLPDPAAQCESTDVTLVSGTLGLGAAEAASAGGEEHADINATYTFRCREPGKLGFVDLTVMKAYPRIGRVQAQVVGSKSQAQQVIKRPAQRLVWPQR